MLAGRRLRAVIFDLAKIIPAFAAHHRDAVFFYVVDGRIAAGLIETKLLRARAVLLQRAPVAAFVAISASMDDPQAPAEQQLTGFLEANQPFTRYLAMLPQ